MKIDIKTKYEPKAGDILSWKDGKDKILFVVVENKPDKLLGIALRDNRGDLCKTPHTVAFRASMYFDKLSLEIEAKEVERKLSGLLTKPEWNE